MTQTKVHQRIVNVGQVLTESESKLTQVILENINQLSSYSATELAQLAHVSKATTARFFKRLGYASFHEFRLEARELQDTASPLYEFIQQKHVDGGFVGVEQHVKQELKNITQTFEQFDTQAFQQSIDMLGHAHTIYIVGFRNSHHLAHYMWLLLAQICPNVRLVSGQSALNFIEELVDLNQKDVLVIMDYRRRVHLMRQITDHAAMVKAKILRFTDLSLLEQPAKADVTLRTFTKSTAMFDSYSAVISLIHSLCTQLAIAQEINTQSRLGHIEQLHQHYKDLDL
ncbi:MurR/RpiR family transcriptional regulator [Acinetobacter rathckeae]|uniref:MurR/RpiR family transcriptional regulator n=1 Tax=Acinetobacter rathckeae TaxID=2605272 RepID=UPI0018A30D2A|nr:MurR/RpiR family transcriptional regulator [Acinetobacter rathckeae]MBF7688158.1 MurR/RpiR family transcriptional regulator [Acinetobacter rathckeae]MBF7695330.1 MurR/RpiR family transcriptional regulator [Acinetobacter rathckeae]